MSDIELLNTGILLFIEWIRTLFIFSIIDRLFIRRKIVDTLRTHDTYISSLVVAAFLILTRGKNLSTLSFLLWALITMFVYTSLKLILNIFIN